MELKITFPDGAEYDSMLVTHLGGNQYKAEESIMSLGESEQVIRYSDIFEVELTSENEGRFQRIVQASSYETSMRIIQPALPFAPEFKDFPSAFSNLVVTGKWCLAEC